MAVNLINSSDIEITQTGDNIQLSTTVGISTLNSKIETNTTNISNNSTAITNLQTYSTSEVNTGKKWIDGKDIYRRVYQKTSTAATENIDIDDWNVDFVCLFVPLIYDSTNRQFDTNYYVNSSDFLRALTRMYNNKFTITVQRGNSNSRVLTIIMEYTKSS